MGKKNSERRTMKIVEGKGTFMIKKENIHGEKSKAKQSSHYLNQKMMKQQREEEDNNSIINSCPTHSLPSLPIDTVTEILARLPPKSLLMFRSICKSWRDIIDSHHFIRNMHLPRVRAASPIHFLLREKKDVFYFDYGTLDSTLRQIHRPFSMKESEACYIASCCDGLLCFVRRRYPSKVCTFYVVNPLIGRFVRLPRVRCFDPILSCQLFWSPPKRVGGSGGGVYKALLIYKNKAEVVRSFICTIGLDSGWRFVTNHFTSWGPFPDSIQYSVVNGAVHCINGHNTDMENHVAAFDILLERFRVILFPRGCCSSEKKCWYSANSSISLQSHMPRLVELRGLLSLFHMNCDGSLMESWLLTDYSCGVWTKDRTICLEFMYKELHLDMQCHRNLNKSLLLVYPDAKINDRELVMRIGTNIPSLSSSFNMSKTYVQYFFSYDPMLNKTTLLSGPKHKRLFIDGRYSIYGPYIETLVSPCKTSSLISKKKKKKKKKKRSMKEHKEL